MELNAGEIKKALKCCGDGSINGCQGCPRNYSDPCETADCRERLMRDAVSVIRELKEENGNLRAENAEQDKAIVDALERMGEIRRETKADTVRKMAEQVKERCKKLFSGVDVCIIVDLIVDEMLEGKNDNT